MRVVPVPVLHDNYAYLLIDENSKTAAAVDPAEPDKVLAAADRERVAVRFVLTTHHHADHAGGNEGMRRRASDVKIYGGDKRIPALDADNLVQDGSTFKIGELNVKVHFTPCHTTGHVLYEVSGAAGEPRALFTGDTLFIGGCGRFFEGSPQQMYHALIEVVARLPPDTKVYCGHEYTTKNLQFAATIEPENPAVQDALRRATDAVAAGRPTVPSTVESELTYNPFMRVHTDSVGQALGLTDPIEIMAELRRRKDKF